MWVAPPAINFERLRLVWKRRQRGCEGEISGAGDADTDAQRRRIAPCCADARDQAIYCAVLPRSRLMARRRVVRPIKAARLRRFQPAELRAIFRPGGVRFAPYFVKYIGE